MKMKIQLKPLIRAHTSSWREFFIGVIFSAVISSPSIAADPSADLKTPATAATLDSAKLSSPKPAKSGPTSPAMTTSSNGCVKNSGLSRAKRIAVLNKVVSDAKAELAKYPDDIEDEFIRDLVGTFAAGQMSDDTLFISMDRSCWAHFHSAHRNLIAGDEFEAAEYARFWKDCLAYLFPERVSIAKPYFNCFKLSKKK